MDLVRVEPGTVERLHRMEQERDVVADVFVATVGDLPGRPLGVLAPTADEDPSHRANVGRRGAPTPSSDPRPRRLLGDPGLGEDGAEPIVEEGERRRDVGIERHLVPVAGELDRQFEPRFVAMDFAGIGIPAEVVVGGQALEIWWCWTSWWSSGRT